MSSSSSSSVNGSRYSPCGKRAFVRVAMAPRMRYTTKYVMTLSTGSLIRLWPSTACSQLGARGSECRDDEVRSRAGHAPEDAGRDGGRDERRHDPGDRAGDDDIGSCKVTLQHEQRRQSDDGEADQQQGCPADDVERGVGALRRDAELLASSPPAADGERGQGDHDADGRGTTDQQLAVRGVAPGAQPAPAREGAGQQAHHHRHHREGHRERAAEWRRCEVASR